MAKTTNIDLSSSQAGAGKVERGVNLLTNSSSAVVVDGAEEAVEKYNRGEITAQEFYDLMLNAEVVYIDRSSASEFKDSKDNNLIE